MAFTKITNLIKQLRRILKKYRAWIVLLSIIDSSFSATPNLSPSSRLAVPTVSKEAFIPYFSSHPIDQPLTNITRLLVMIHSSTYDASAYYDQARRTVTMAGINQETLIIAPQFLKKSVLPDTVSPGLVHWRVSPFRGSSKAAVGPNSKKVRLSAYQVIDDLLNSIIQSNRYPNLTDLVLFGHSAGGQFIQRYALTSRFEAPAGMNLRFVVSAPSSYAYPTPKRFDRHTRQWSRPASTLACPDYHDWGYGLNRPYRYLADDTPHRLLTRYAKRVVFYLCGSRDDNPNHRTLSTTCGAYLQGSHRLERMQWFEEALKHTYGQTVGNRHVFFVVPGVGHHSAKIMSSPQGLDALFSPVSKRSLFPR